MHLLEGLVVCMLGITLPPLIDTYQVLLELFYCLGIYAEFARCLKHNS
jgi:hypothetical protein